MKKKIAKFIVFIIVLLLNFLVIKNVSVINSDKLIVQEGETSFFSWLVDNESTLNFIIAVTFCIVLDIALFRIFFSDKGYLSIVKDIKDNYKMIARLSKNDFKMRYASSYFGVFWAFMQPIVTIVIYVFVFQIGFKAGGTENGYHYVLFLIAGIIPWFFLTEGIMGCTNCFIEYSYLVKKVVFKIDVLPIVKIISACFIHLFFIALAVVVFLFNGKLPTLYYLQIMYYMICAIAFILVLAYFTASVTPFFQDFSQIVNIIMQIGMWAAPIMWKEDMIPINFRWIIEMNPVYYIVEGYRDSMIYQTPFWEKPELTIWFWLIVLVIYLFSHRTFMKLKVHFADVL